MKKPTKATIEKLAKQLFVAAWVGGEDEKWVVDRAWRDTRPFRGFHQMAEYVLANYTKIDVHAETAKQMYGVAIQNERSTAMQRGFVQVYGRKRKPAAPKSCSIVNGKRVCK